MVTVHFFNGLEIDDTFELALFLVWWEEREETDLVRDRCVCVCVLGSLGCNIDYDTVITLRQEGGGFLC